MKITLDRMLNVLLVGLIAFLAWRYFNLQPRFEDGAASPDFTVQNIDGRAFTLSELRGKYVLVDFWGSWCGPCRRQNPKLVALYDQFHDQTFSDAAGFEIVSVALERSERAWKQAIEKDGLRWPYHVLDRGGEPDSFGGKIAGRFGVRSIPTTFLLDPQGVVISVNPSRRKVERLLSKRQL